MPEASLLGRRAEGEIKCPAKLVVDPGRSSSGRGVQFPPVSTIFSSPLSRSPRDRLERVTLSGAAQVDVLR